MLYRNLILITTNSQAKVKCKILWDLVYRFEWRNPIDRRDWKLLIA